MPKLIEDMSTGFRLYVNNMYYAAMHERNRYSQPECSLQEYWDQNKFWLKEKYKTDGNVIDS